MNIYEKINAIMAEVQKLQKDDNVAFGNTKYKALSEEKVTTIMRQQLVKHKLVVFPIWQEWSRTGNITHVNVQYRMVNVENPEEFIEIASCGDGADTQDKGSGKAMTYAFKYMWLRTFALPTGEDPDKISSEELDAKEAELITKKDVALLKKIIGEENFPAWTKHFGKDKIEDLTKMELGQIHSYVQRKKEEQAKAEKLKEIVDANESKVS